MEKILPLKKKLFFLIVLCLFAYNSQAQDNDFTYNNNGTLVVPTGQTYVVTIHAWGAGGAGSRRTTSGAGGGGGGGAYSRSTVTLSAGTYRYYSGTPGDGDGSGVVNGGDSYFTDNAGTVVYCRAKGGTGAILNSTSGGAGGNKDATDAVGDVRYSGGNGANGLTLVLTGYSGGGGSSAGTATNGASGSLSNGGNAPTGGGDGGDGIAVGNNQGNDGQDPGGGGGGAYRSSGNQSGGDGGDGQIRITWYNQEINVQGNGANILDGGSGTPSLTNDTNFGAAYIFGGSVTKTFTIYNTGGASLTLSTPTFAGTDAGDFSIVTAPTSPVLPGSSTTFSVKFDPNGAGSRVATISFVNNDSNENPYNWNLSGTGNAYTDSDGDGVTDESDLDDDNDGVTDAIEQAGCTASPLATSVEHTFLNETFGNGTTYTEIDENITTASTTYSYVNSGDVNDGYYTVKNSAQITSWASEYWHRGTDHTGDTNGKMAVFNASFATGTFYSTTITGLTANIPVKYSFWVINLDRTDAPGIGTRIRPNVRVEFRRSSNNALITYLETGNISPTVNTTGAGSWYNFSSEFTAPETSIKVIFINNATGGLGNDLALDDILITQKYCDMDNDGDADIFDLDDDNDGIPDVVEAGLRAFSSNKSKMDISNPALWKDVVLVNGMNDAVDTMISNGTYTTLYVKDTDGDGVKDIFDVDSDNDGIFDIDEAQTDTFAAYYNGDGDIDGDGKGDGTDVDSDGIRDINDDNTSTYGTTNKAYPVDTDGDGTPNYLDLTSNGGTAKDIAGTIYASLDGNSDGKIDGTTDVDKDGILDSFDGDTAAIGSPRNITTKKLLIDFDGRNDYAESIDLLSTQSKATIMGWIKLDANFTNAAIVMGQDNFYISVNASKQLVATAKGVSIVYTTTPLVVSRWYHVAAVYEAAGTKKLILYLNGTELISSNAASLSGTLGGSSYKFTIGKNAASSTNYFRGFIDEVRVFSSALLPDQLSTMVCQEIDINGTKVKGAIISKDLDGITGTTNWSTNWADLSAYFRMDNYKGDVIDDYKTNSVIDSGTSTTLARIYNVKYLKDQTVSGAPMPFVTTANGAIDTNDGTNVITNTAGFIYGPDVKNYPAAIIQVKHNVTSSNNLTQVGLIVDAGKTITMNNDTKIENTWYLNLQGKIDLQGKSQLIQTTNSTTASTTTGSLERDQQGTKNVFNYNYWSSPVSTINNSTINNGYTVNGVFKDGTTSSYQNITWTDGYDGVATSPITLSRSWIYKYQNNTANWTYVGETGSLSAGQGFTLKGSGAASSTQNYTFIGKPNNGTIPVTILANNLSLVGNPYPSAISAYEFIRDNITPGNTGSSNVILGTLYFWEHSTLNASHTYADYQGGYAVRNLIGGLPPVVATGTSGLGGNTREPYLYIPVGQAFFVEGSATGGTLNFKNSQRGFQKEDGGNSNIMFRAASSTAEVNNNANDPIAEETFMKIRIGFDSNESFHRQLLLGFMDEYATDGFDPGYDAGNFDDNPSDMYFVNDTNKLVIQGVGTFSEANKYQLGVKNAITGPVTFTLDRTENMDEDQDIFIYDALTSQYHNIKDQDFEVTLEAGTYEERFSLRFTNQVLGVENPALTKNIEIVYSNSDEMLTIVNYLSDSNVQSVSIFNILGQQISVWDVSNETQQKIEIPVKNLSSGTYIVKVETDTNSVTKKIAIR